MVVLAMFLYNAFHVGRLMEREDEFQLRLRSCSSMDAIRMVKRSEGNTTV